MSKNNFFKKSIFLGPKSICVGSASNDRKNFWEFKPIGDFGKLMPVVRISEVNEFYFVELDEYNPKIGDFTGDKWRVFFFDLIDGSKFSFNDSSPTQIMLGYKTLQVENLHLKNSFQNLLKLIEASSIDDYRRKQVQDIVEQSRKIISYNPSPTPMQTQK